MKSQIIENYIGAAIFALLGVVGLAGVCAGFYVHLFTVAVGGIMSWTLWAEARKVEKELANTLKNE